MKKKSLTDLLLFIVGTELVGALSALLSGGNFSAFYNSLKQPPLAPPGAVFPIVWAILYALMGISAYMIYRTDNKWKNSALLIYGIQLFFNFLWSIVFFRFEKLGVALAVIIILFALILWMLLVFGRIRKAAALLNIPYLLWVAFAIYLNAGVLILNQ